MSTRAPSAVLRRLAAATGRARPNGSALAAELLKIQAEVSKTLPELSARDFGSMWILQALVAEVLKYSIEDDYVAITPELQKKTAQEFAQFWRRRPRLKELDSLLQTVREVALSRPFEADFVEVRAPQYDCKFLALLAAAGSPEIPVSATQKALVPILEDSLSRPEYADQVVGTFEAILRKIGNEQGLDGLCFIEKSAGPVGAVTMHTSLVSKLGVPAFIFRDGYWVKRARISGVRPTSGQRIAIVYDLLVTGDGIRHVAEQLGRDCEADVVGAVVLSGFDDQQARLTVDGHGFSVDAIVWQNQIKEEIDTARSTRTSTRHLRLFTNGRSSSATPASHGGRTHVSHGKTGGIVTDHRWKSSLEAYGPSGLRTLSFDSISELNRAVDLIWESPELSGVPNESPDGISLIVPLEAVSVFTAAALEFEVTELGNQDELPLEQLRALRHHHGM